MDTNKENCSFEIGRQKNTCQASLEIIQKKLERLGHNFTFNLFSDNLHIIGLGFFDYNLIDKIQIDTKCENLGFSLYIIGQGYHIIKHYTK